MKKNRFVKPIVVAVGLVFLCAMPGLANSDNAPHNAAPTPKTASPAVQPQKDTAPPDDFAGLNYTDEQKAEIARIHRETESQKAAVLKDEKLTADQKDAMLTGYARMEYVQYFKSLTPEQQKMVRRKIVARRSTERAAMKKKLPRN